MRLAVVAALLAAVGAGTGLAWTGEGGPQAHRSVHGEQVELAGSGLYRHDSVTRAAVNRGTDFVVLLIGVPLLLAAARGAGRGSLSWGLLLAGALGWIAYLYGTMAVGTAFNELFLLYAALAATGLWGLVFAVRALPDAPLAELPAWGAPRRSLAAFLAVLAAVTVALWAGSILVELLSGLPPTLLDHETTLVTHAIDLVVLVPASMLGAVLVLRGNPRAYAIAVPLLVLLVVLVPVLASQTAFVLATGVELELGEVAGPTVAPALLGLASAVLLVRILRAAAAL